MADNSEGSYYEFKLSKVCSPQYALVFWDNDDKNYAFDVIDARPIPSPQLSDRLYGYIPARVSDGTLRQFFGRVHAVGGKFISIGRNNSKCHRLMTFLSTISECRKALYQIGKVEQKRLEQKRDAFYANLHSEKSLF